MHPPLDRPHPYCQKEIQALRECHKTKPLWKIWACNEMKFALDRCFKEEKKIMREQDQAEAAANFDELDRRIHNMTFAEYLKTDKIYQREMAAIQAKKKGQA